MKKKVYLILLIISIISITACTQSNVQLEETDNTDKNWKDIQLKDISTGNTFTVNDFKDKFVLVESFAVWCPTCTQQQKEIKELKERNNQIVSISLNTDPNEDEQKVLEHIQRNEFDWRYAISPTSLTQKLIDNFGVGVINAPSAPVILVCNGQEELLKTGLKSTEELANTIKSKCSGGPQL